MWPNKLASLNRLFNFVKDTKLDRALFTLSRISGTLRNLFNLLVIKKISSRKVIGFGLPKHVRSWLLPVYLHLTVMRWTHVFYNFYWATIIRSDFLSLCWKRMKNCLSILISSFYPFLRRFDRNNLTIRIKNSLS